VTDDGEPFWPEASQVHALAKLYEIVVALTWTQPPDVRQRILDVGGDRFAPYRTIRNSHGWVSLNLALADGSVIHLGEFHVSELDEPFINEEHDE
jgi:hypothetical protein